MPGFPTGRFIFPSSFRRKPESDLAGDEAPAKPPARKPLPSCIDRATADHLPHQATELPRHSDTCAISLALAPYPGACPVIPAQAGICHALRMPACAAAMDLQLNHLTGVADLPSPCSDSGLSRPTPSASHPAPRHHRRTHHTTTAITAISPGSSSQVENRTKLNSFRSKFHSR